MSDGIDYQVKTKELLSEMQFINAYGSHDRAVELAQGGGKRLDPPDAQAEEEMER